MAYGPQIPGLDRSGGVNLAAPGAIGGTTAGTGAFTTLTASSTLAVTGATTLTGELTLGGGTDLLRTNSSLSTYSGGSSNISFGSSQPDLQYATDPIWIRVYIGYNSYYLPLWSTAPPM